MLDDDEVMMKMLYNHTVRMKLLRLLPWDQGRGLAQDSDVVRTSRGRESWVSATANNCTESYSIASDVYASIHAETSRATADGARGNILAGPLWGKFFSNFSF